jgi:chromosome segregation ATPase
LDDGVELTETAHQLHERLNDLELRLRADLNTSTDQTEAAAKLVQAADKFADEALQVNSTVQKWSNLAKSLRERAHPRAQTPIAELQSAVNARWQQVEGILAEKSAAVRDLHAELLGHDKLMKDLEGFVASEREELAERNGKCAETWTLPEIQE